MNLEAERCSGINKGHKGRLRERVGKYARIAALAGTIAVFPIQDTRRPTFEGQTFHEQVKRAKKEMEIYGITTEQSATYKPILSDLIYEGVYPTFYTYNIKKITVGDSVIPIDKIFEMSANIIDGRKDKRRTKYNSREDAWRLYLGLRQTHDTFGISDYKPSKGIEKKYYFQIKNFWESMQNSYGGDGRIMIKELLSNIHNGIRIPEPRDIKVMLRYIMGAGKDGDGSYISYYDRWDVDKIFLEGKNGFIGKPFEIYDRLYYNPETFEPLNPISTSMSYWKNTKR
jgi:hypothetical protein